MKEYCLVPRKKLDEEKKENEVKQNIINKIGGSGTRDRASKVIRKKIFKKKRKNKIIKPRKDPLPLPEKKQENKNPELDFLLEMEFPKTKVKYVKAFMNYVKDKPNISWNEMGYLNKPFQGYNVIRMLHKLIAERSYLNVNDLPFYKMFIKMTDIPYEAIKNELAKSQLEGVKDKKNCS